MSATKIRCELCDLDFASLTEKLQHMDTRQHQQLKMETTGKEPPPRPVNVKPDLVTEADKMRAEAFLKSFKRDYFVCPAGTDLGDFLKEHNIKIAPDEEEEGTPTPA